MLWQRLKTFRSFCGILSKSIRSDTYLRKTTLTTVWKIDSGGVRLDPEKPSGITGLIRMISEECLKEGGDREEMQNRESSRTLGGFMAYCAQNVIKRGESTVML